MQYVVPSSLSTDEPIMLINKHIGLDAEDGPGILGDLFQAELMELDNMGFKRIQVWINSPGGSVVDGYAIYNAIIKSKTPVDTYCVGLAASIAGVFFQAGRNRIMCDYGILMYHNPFGGDDKVLAAMRASLTTMISSRCGMTDNEVALMMARTTYIGAEEAMAKGLCDDIESSIEANIKYKRNKSNPEKAFWKEATEVLNSYLSTDINQVEMSTNASPKVTMRLKLNDSAPENDIVAAIDAIENRATTAETSVSRLTVEVQNAANAHKTALDKLQAEVDDAKNKLAAKEKEYTDQKALLDAMETDKKNAQAAEAKLKAENMVEGFAKAGRIKNEETVKLQWNKLAIADFDGTKAMIEALPLNKDATKITEAVANVVSEGKLPTTTIGLAVKNRLKRMGK